MFVGVMILAFVVVSVVCVIVSLMHLYLDISASKLGLGEDNVHEDLGRKVI